MRNSQLSKTISLLKVLGNVLFCKGTLSWKGKIYLPRTSDNSTRITPLASILQVLWSIFCQYHRVLPMRSVNENESLIQFFLLIV